MKVPINDIQFNFQNIRSLTYHSSTGTLTKLWTWMHKKHPIPVLVQILKLSLLALVAKFTFLQSSSISLFLTSESLKLHLSSIQFPTKFRRLQVHPSHTVCPLRIFRIKFCRQVTFFSFVCSNSGCAEFRRWKVVRLIECKKNKKWNETYGDNV